MDMAPRELAFEPIRTRRAFEEICDRIREQLENGVLRPGDKLPPERDLARRFEVGRSALREALRSLENAGILRLVKGVKGGAFIRDGEPRFLAQVVQDQLHLGSITVEELTETRVYLMDLVIRLACERARRADIDALEKNVELTAAMTREGRYLERVECSREFYRLLAACTRNQVLSLLIESVTDILMKFVKIRVAAGGKPQPGLVAKREALVRLEAAGDADRAARLMHLHLQSVHRLLKQSLPLREGARK